MLIEKRMCHHNLWSAFDALRLFKNKRIDAKRHGNIQRSLPFGIAIPSGLNSDVYFNILSILIKARLLAELLFDSKRKCQQ